eukprot:6131046-Pyramimonas_sp.AAC.1
MNNKLDQLALMVGTLTDRVDTLEREHKKLETIGAELILENVCQRMGRLEQISMLVDFLKLEVVCDRVVTGCLLEDTHEHGPGLDVKESRSYTDECV